MWLQAKNRSKAISRGTVFISGVKVFNEFHLMKAEIEDSLPGIYRASRRPKFNSGKHALSSNRRSNE